MATLIRPPLSALLRVQSTVAVSGADDVVFTQIGTALHFDKAEWDSAWVLEPVRRARGNVDRLVILEQRHLVIDSDLRAAGDHNPVLGAVMMHPERQLLAG